MALGFKRNKGGSEDPVAEQSAPAAARQRKLKPNERLASVVKESAPGAAVDVLSRNEKFVLPGNAGWLLLLLNVETPAFGGLSAKHKSDEAKGSIIELITADEIEVVVTPEMLSEDMLGIVPSASTLERMGEYSLLTSAPYVWIVMTKADGDTLTANPVADATYAQALDVSQGRTTVAELLPEVWAWANEDESSAEAGSEAGPEADEDAVEADEEAVDDEDAQWADESEQPFGPADDEPVEDAGAEPELFDPEDEGAVDYGAMDEADGGDEPLEEEWVDDEPEDDAAGAFDGLDEDEDDEPEPDAYTEYVTKNYGREADLAEVRETVIRRLSPEDLDLTIDTEEFVRTFSADAPAVTIEVGNADAWLAEQVADYVRQANAQIEKLHGDNAAELQREYVALMSQHAEKVGRDHSATAHGTRYFELMRSAKDDFDRDKAHGNERSSAGRSEITQRFEKDADEAAKAAGEAARARFHSQNRSLRERLLAEVSTKVESEIEERYAHNRQVVLDMRRKDAALAMELGSTKAMQLLAERQDEQRAQEVALLKEWNERILAFIDDNRKHDVARTEALAEKLSRETQVADLTEQFAREREQLAAEHQARIRELEARMIANRDEALADVREREEHWAHELKLEQAKTANANGLVAKMEEQMGRLSDTYEGQYGDRIATLISDKESYSNELERANHIQSRANKIMVVLIIVLSLAAVAVGIIIGWAWANANLADGMVLAPLLNGIGLPPGGATP